MNKKLAIFAIVLLVVGIVGTTWSGILVMPELINFKMEKEAEFKKEKTIYQEKVNIDKLDVSVDNVSVTIKKHAKDNVLVTTKGSNKFYKYNAKVDNKTLKITGNLKEENTIRKIKNFEQLVNTSIDSMFSYDYRELVIYVPNNVDINVSSLGSSLLVYNDVPLNNITYKTSHGSFERVAKENKINKLDTLNIISNDNVYLSTKSILGVKNVNIDVASLDMSSEDEDIFIDNIEQHIPENMKIRENSSRNSQYNNFDIQSNFPIARNLDIDTPSSRTELRLPVSKYKFNCDIKSSEIIDWDDGDSDGHSSEDWDNGDSNKHGNGSGKMEHSMKDSNMYRDVREIKGILNSNVSNLAPEYNLKINSMELGIY